MTPALSRPLDRAVTVPVPASVVDILVRLERAGYETWCVGGAIRDALLGRTGNDVDLATAALPTDVRRVFRRTVPVGIEHGTVGVLDDDGVLHEVTTFRRDVRTDGRHAQVEFGVTLDDDLARRDFTINAIAFHPVRGEWRDPFDGRDAIRRREVAAVGDAATRFREDRLRILRALRFAARLDFTITADTWSAALSQAPATRSLSAERVADEWIKGLRTAMSVERLVALWRDSGIAEVWLPELVDTPAYDAELIDGAERDVVVITACWCVPSMPVWVRLKASNATIRRAAAIDAGPPRPHGSDEREIRRWLATVGAAADDLLRLAAWRGEEWEPIARTIIARGDPISLRQLAVVGADLLAAGFASGPAMGRLLSQLLDAVVDDPSLNTSSQLLELARRFA